MATPPPRGMGQVGQVGQQASFGVPNAASSACAFDSLSDAQLMHLCINGNEHDARCAEGEIDRRGGDNNVQIGQSLTLEGVQALAAAGMPVLNSAAAQSLPPSPAAAMPRPAPASAETAEQAAKRRWLESNDKNKDAPRGTPAPSAPTRSAPAAAQSAYIFDHLSDAQLMHLCINGNEHDARCAEGEIDRRGGDNNVQPGQSLTTEGVQALAAAGMPP